MSSVSSSKMYTLVAVFFIIGLIIGYGVSLAFMPSGEEKVITTGLQGEVKIGVILPLTGPISTYGENSRVVAELAESDVNQWLNNIGANWTLKLAIEDTASDPKTALDKVQTLNGLGVQLIVGPITSPVLSEIKSYADSNKILVISPAANSVSLSIPGDWIYRYDPDVGAEGPSIARIAWDAGVRYLVIMWAGNTWADAVEQSTVPAFQSLLSKNSVDGSVTEALRYDPTAKEFSMEVANLNDVVSKLVEDHGADKVGIALISWEEAAMIFDEADSYPTLKEVKWIGADAVPGSAVIANDPTAAAFAVKSDFPSPVFSPGNSPIMKYVRDYVKNKLGRDPDPYSYATYDAIWTIAIALQLVGKYDSDAVRNVLPDVLKHYYGAVGYIELNENGDNAFANWAIWVVRNQSGGYTWDIAGTYYPKTDSIQWESWWLELHPEYKG